MTTRYAAIDIETTGLNPATCQVVEFGCVVETDWQTPVSQLPRLHLLVEHRFVMGEPVALAMHHDLLTELAKPEPERAYETVAPSQVADRLQAFLAPIFGDQAPTLAGKNFGMFDHRFLSALPGWDSFRHRHRVIDPGMLWWNPSKDAAIPSTGECLSRAKIASALTHRAVDDCEAVIRLVRRKFGCPVE
jgi:oligoribonuclease (3'-5' exoribonuclease)